MNTRKKVGRPRAGGLDHELKTRIDAELHRQVQERAAREERSEAAIVRRAIRAYLGAEEVVV